MYIDKNSDIIINKSIMHILNNKADIPVKVLSDLEMDESEEINKILKAHIRNSITNKNRRMAKFKGTANAIESHCLKIYNHNDDFIETSKEIAMNLFDIMKGDRRISSAYLIICKFKLAEETFVSILKLDFSENLVPIMIDVDGKLKLGIKVEGNGIPNNNEKLHKCVFFNPNMGQENNEIIYNLILLDRQEKDEDKGAAGFFKNTFLHCELAITDRDNTRIFRGKSKVLIESMFKNDSEKIIESESYIRSRLQALGRINIYEVSEVLFAEDEEKKERYIKEMQESNVDMDFDLDKDWVYENIRNKKREIITKEGVKLELTDIVYNNNDLFEIEYFESNGEKKANILIKNASIKSQS